MMTIETDILDFMREKVDSFIKWDLVRFFHDNPHMTDTAENIAGYTGRDKRTIERELDGLVRSSVLKNRQVSGVTVYMLTDDELIQTKIGEFMAACHDRQFRVEAIQVLIKGMQYTPRHDF